jgi:hypothetical protein
VASIASATELLGTNLGPLSQLTLERWIAVAGVIAAISGTFAAVWTSRRTAVKNCDQQYFTEYNRRYQEVVSRAPSDIRDPKFELAGRSDRERILQLAHAYLDLCFEQWHLYQRGLVTSKLWSFWKSGMTVGFSRPAFQQAWIIIRAEKRCDKKFLSFVDGLALGAHTKVRPFGDGGQIVQAALV